MPLSPATRKATLLSDTSPSATSTAIGSPARAMPAVLAASAIAMYNPRTIAVIGNPPVEVLVVRTSLAGWDDGARRVIICHGRACPGHPRLDAMEKEDVDARNTCGDDAQSGLSLPVHQHLLDLGDGFGRVEVFRADLGAVHDGV